MKCATIAVGCLLIGWARPAAAIDLPVQSPNLGAGRASVTFAQTRGPMAVLRVRFNVGSADDGTRGGVTRLCQHLLLLSNRAFAPEAYYDKLFAAGATLDITTTPHRAAFTLVAPRESFTPLATKLLRALLAPRVDGSGFARAAERTLQDELLPGELGGFTQQVLQTILVGRRYEGLPHGTRESVQALTGQDASRQLERFVASNATVFVAGAPSPSAIVAAVRRFRGGVPGDIPSRASNQTGKQVIPSFVEAHVVAAPVELHLPDSAARALLAQQLIGEQVFWQLREEGLTYGAGARLVSTRAGSWLLVEVVSNPDRSIDAEKSTLDVLARATDRDGWRFTFGQAKERALADIDSLEDQPHRVVQLLDDGWTSDWTSLEESLASLDEAEFNKWIEPRIAASSRSHVHFSIEAKREELIEAHNRRINMGRRRGRRR